MTNPSNLVITGLDGYFILNFLQKSGLVEMSIEFLGEMWKILKNLSTFFNYFWKKDLST